ncbi:tetratricopeptide repeat protein [Telmatocola sphagniphila]|uniref:Tetratricopeptide repeat protein n=1 Tax=Telmatocola sphagniphila TaxID=1123043 RepID=A0A8E6EY20_9BACT|nr:tetratricopeptide repeat protein [Telmatocola sphagniphila]QVL32228.1 tetratricopeptide repeat protein [Telmatocola sphagniphila]
MDIPLSDLAPVRELYGKGLYLRAWKKAQELGPIKDWSNPAARLLGGRLVIQLGAPRLGHWLHLRAFRDNPTYHEAIYYNARYRFEKFGPLATWRFMRQHMEWYDAAPNVRADWIGLQGFIAGRLRDFDRAERLLNRADSTAPDRPWLLIERASVYEFSERYEEALACARRSQELSPYFRPGVQAEAHLLQRMGREQEALEVLERACEHIESGLVVAHLASGQLDLGMVEAARKNYERYAELSPLLEEDVQKWLAARRCDTAFFLGDLEMAKSQAPLAVLDKEPFYAQFAERLNNLSGPIPASIRLDQTPAGVAVRKSPVDTPPAELLAKFWGKTEGLFQPSDTPPSDGLPDIRERAWLESLGFSCVEAQFAPDTVYALLENGIPFLITLVDSGYTHSFVAMGCNRLRESIWMIDNGERKANEAPISPILERYASIGPRLLAILPAAEADRFEKIPFVERAEYDRLYRVLSALAKDDRATADGLLKERESSNQRLDLLGRLALARYDANPTRTVQQLDQLLSLYPNDVNFQLSRMNSLRELGRREERNRLTNEQVEKFDGEPLFAQYFAQMALADFRLYSPAITYLRRAIRKRQHNAGAYYLLASLLWEKREYEEATEVYRMAAALEDKDEQFAESYWRAARSQGQAPEAKRFLQARHNRAKARAAETTRALFYAYIEENEIDQGFQAIREAIAAEEQALSAANLDPERNKASILEEVGDLYLFLAEMRLNFNDADKVEEAMTEAEKRLSPVAFARGAARLASQQAKLLDAFKYNGLILEQEPRNLEAYRSQVRLVSDLEGREAAIAGLEAACKKFPHFYPLQQLLIEWHRSDNIPPGGSNEELPAEAVIRRMIADCPEDAWAHRELALHLASRGRCEEALVELDFAKNIEPESPSYYYTLGHVYARADRVEQAREAYEQVIRLSVDNDLAIGELVNLARGEEEKKEALEFIGEEIQKQPVVAEGLMSYRDQALQILEPEDILRVVQNVLDEKPEIWQAWSVAIQLLSMSGRMEEAKELAKGATETFPLVSRLWVDLAEICEATEDIETQLNALRRALEISPNWGFAARELSECLEESHPEEARVVLEQAVARSPLDPVNHGYLADHLWNVGESEEAFSRLCLALKLDPGYEWAWRALGEWAERMEDGDRALTTVREVAHLRPGDYRTWLALARMLSGPAHHDEALDALNRAIKLNARCIEAYDMKAERLAEIGRYDEAKTAATPSIFDPDPPMILQGRAAWVEARRGNLPQAIREMQALVTLEPHYYWGWQQLAEWHNEMNNSEEFLEATRKLVEMRPDSPVALAMRGEAKLQVGDKEGAHEDLREAQQLAPAYSYAGMLLFDSLIQEEEYEAARPVLAVLQEHVGGSGQPFVLARHAQLAARTQDEEGGESALREVCTLPCDSTWPINTAVSELRNAGYTKMVDRVLKEILETEPKFHPYILMSWIEGPSGQASEADEKLQMMDKVITAIPDSFQAYDMKAELLSRLGRYDEALQTCKPDVFPPDEIPLALRGRSAWVLGSQNRLDEAIAAMKTLLEEDPEYYWGWQQLANWYDSTGNHQEYLSAAESLVKLDPGNPASHAYRGEAKLYGGDRRGAKVDFQKAFELDNSYAFAGLHLIDEQLADGELEAANGTLARLQEHNDGPYIRLRALRLAARKKDAEGCRDIFRSLALDENAPAMVVNKMIESLQQSGYKAEVDNWLTELIDEPEATPIVGKLWIEHKAAQNDYDFESKLPELMERGEIGQEAVFAAVEACAKPNQRTRLDRLLEKYRPTLERDNRGWAKVALAYEAVNELKEGAKWIEDWPNRQPESPWIFHPPALILRALGQYEQAEEITRRALDLDDEDSSVPEFRVWLAFEETLRGKTEEANAQLKLSNVQQLSDTARIIYTLTETLILVQQTSPKHRRGAFDEARRRVKECIFTYAPKVKSPDLSKSYQRFIRCLAKEVGGIEAWLWSMKQKINPPV